MRATRAAGVMSAVLAGAALGTLSGDVNAQVVFGQLDDFEDGTTMGWVHGPVSPTPPTNIPTGGPKGADDNYLQNTSIGGFSAGSRHVMFNETRWSGDFVAAGVTRITGFMINLGETDLHMRLALQGGMFGSRYASSNAVALPVGGGWQPVTFSLTASHLTEIAGGEPLADVLANVTTLRILSAQAGPTWFGDAMVSTLGADDLRAMHLPGDANFDGNVNLADFNTLAANFGTTSGASWQQADFDFNGNVNLADFNLLAANFGMSIAGPNVTPEDWSALGTLVPEPSVGLLAPALGLLSARRRHRSG